MPRLSDLLHYWGRGPAEKLPLSSTSALEKLGTGRRVAHYGRTIIKLPEIIPLEGLVWEQTNFDGSDFRAVPVLCARLGIPGAGTLNECDGRSILPGTARKRL